MRLTLRTLLAYMDGVLEPEAQAELEQQIENNPDAKDLIYRTRDTVRRLRLGAPAADAGSDSKDASPLDANTVAEYLDSTASQQSVMDVELNCLRSDMHLAEVGACHQILTMVLGEAAEVDPETRRRMYAIPEVAKLTGASPAAAGAAAPATPESAAPSDTRVTEVPDYIREGSPSWVQRWLPAAAALLVLGGVSFLAFRDGGWLRPAEPPALGKNDSDADPAPPQTTPPPTDAAAEDSGDGPEMPGGPAADPIGANVADAGGQPDAVSEGDPNTNVATAQEQTGASTASDTGAGADGGETTPGEMTPGEGMNGQGEADPAVFEDPGAAAGAAGGSGDSAPATPPSQSDEPAPVGLLSSTRQVLLAYQEGDRSWRRLPIRQTILSGDRLLSLPTYHPIIALTSGFSIGLLDGTELQIESSTTAEPPTLDLAYGRLIIANAGAEPLDCRLKLGEMVATLRIESTANVAVEVDRPFKPGVDPLVAPAPLRALLIAPNGGVEWRAASGDFAVDGPSAWRVIGQIVAAPEPIVPPADGGTAADAVLEIAPWIEEKHLSDTDREASDGLEPKLETDRPIWEYLQPQLTARRPEDQALAAECSACVGRFEPFIRALGNEELRRFWPAAIKTLRAAMSRSPESARVLRDTLIREQDDARAADLYEMLVGYTDEQVGATLEAQLSGVLPVLLERLESATLAYRVLAHYNLTQVTSRAKIYMPSGTERSRQIAVGKLRGRLEAGTLIPPPRP